MPDGGSNAFVFKQAVRENTPMVMALAGASGSGKTFTALELAMGLADGGKIAVIDTEGRRALHYADVRNAAGTQLFRFDHCELRPPFSPERFLAAMKAAEAAGYRVIVIDSFSDEHEGEGGLIDMAAAGTNLNSAANWARPKAAHKLIVRWLRQARCHVLFCLRAEERVRLEKDEKGKTVVVPTGWWPVAEKRLMYDMTASFLLSPAQPGIPEPIKLQEQHRQFFPAGKPVTRESGRLLAAWATGGAAVPPPMRGLDDEARDAAENGKAALTTFWRGLTKEQRQPIAHLIAVGDEPGELARRAAEIDARRAAAVPDEIPFENAATDAPQSPPAGRAGSAPQPTAEPAEPHSAPRDGGAATNSPADPASLVPEKGDRTTVAGAAAPVGEPGSLVIEPAPGRNGKPDWRAWAGAQFLPKLRQRMTTPDLANFLGANEAHLDEARRTLDVSDLRDLNAAITAQWDAVDAGERRGERE